MGLIRKVYQREDTRSLALEPAGNGPCNPC